MGNRNMDAKRVKYIRQSKARPRYLRIDRGQQKVKQSVDRSKIPEEWIPLFEYRDRAKISSLEEFLNSRFPSLNQVSDARSTALRDSKKEERDTVIITWLVDGKFKKVAMRSDTRFTWFSFVEYHTIPGLLRFSITYSNRDRAIQQYERDAVRWKETLQLSVE